MNVVKLYGGLGNQLFQYAFGLAQRANRMDIRYDVSWFKTHQVERPYQLDKFNIEVPIHSFLRTQQTINEVGFAPHLVVNFNYNYTGYWQSPWYFNNVVDELKNRFWVKPELWNKEFIELRKEIQRNKYIGVHIRRGDFLEHHSHYIPPMEYYTQALAIIKALQPSARIMVFSDDIRWCRENFPVKEAEFVTLGIDYLEFELLRLCQYKVTANSTYSWWAAFLNSEMVITPKKWWLKQENQDDMERRYMLPADWIKL
jgi:hypothetical protein